MICFHRAAYKGHLIFRARKKFIKAAEPPSPDLWRVLKCMAKWRMNDLLEKVERRPKNNQKTNFFL
jgi:hypothetical protein